MTKHSNDDRTYIGVNGHILEFVPSSFRPATFFADGGICAHGIHKSAFGLVDDLNASINLYPIKDWKLLHPLLEKHK